MISPSNPDFPEKNELIAELQQASIKHNPEEIVRIGKTPENKVIFLEIGKGGERGSGLTHILENHRQDFINRGIPESEIPDVILTAVVRGKAIGIQGKSRIVYKFEFNQKTHYISVEISTNGYIVGANPTSQRLINKLLRGKSK